MELCSGDRPRPKPARTLSTRVNFPDARALGPGCGMRSRKMPPWSNFGKVINGRLADVPRLAGGAPGSVRWRLRGPARIPVGSGDGSPGGWASRGKGALDRCASSLAGPRAHGGPGLRMIPGRRLHGGRCGETGPDCPGCWRVGL